MPRSLASQSSFSVISTFWLPARPHNRCTVTVSRTFIGMCKPGVSSQFKTSSADITTNSTSVESSRAKPVNAHPFRLENCQTKVLFVLLQGDIPNHVPGIPPASIPPASTRTFCSSPSSWPTSTWQPTQQTCLPGLLRHRAPFSSGASPSPARASARTAVSRSIAHILLSHPQSSLFESHSERAEQESRRKQVPHLRADAVLLHSLLPHQAEGLGGDIPLLPWRSHPWHYDWGGGGDGMPG